MVIVETFLFKKSSLSISLASVLKVNMAAQSIDI
jgi:hypothetical protein